MSRQPTVRDRERMNLSRCALVAVVSLLVAADGASADWLPPEIVSSPNSSNSTPRLAVDAHGDAAAAWRRGKSGQTADRPAGGAWVQNQAFGNDSVAGALSVGIDGQGHAISLVAINNGSQQPIWSVVSYGAANLTPDSAGGADPDIAVNDRGDTVAAWTGFDGIGAIVNGSFRGYGKSWTANQTLNTGPGGSHVMADVAIDEKGDAVVVWERNDRIAASFRPAGGSWSAEHLLSPGKKSGDAHVALDAQGHATVVWVSASSYGYNVIAGAEGSAAGGWGPAHEIAFDGPSSAPSLSVSPGGSAVLAWQRDNGGH